MLTQMSIRNFALIEQMNISFNDGITIFTGETGASIFSRYSWPI